MGLNLLQGIRRTSISLRPLPAEVYTILSASAILGNQLTCVEPLTTPCCGLRPILLCLDMLSVCRPFNSRVCSVCRSCQLKRQRKQSVS